MATMDGGVPPSLWPPLLTTLTGRRKALTYRDLDEVRCRTDGPPQNLALCLTIWGSGDISLVPFFLFSP